MSHDPLKNKRDPRGLTEKQAECLDLYDEGLDIGEIARRTGRARGSVHQLVDRALNVVGRGGLPRRNNKTPLTMLGESTRRRTSIDQQVSVSGSRQQALRDLALEAGINGGPLLALVDRLNRMDGTPVEPAEGSLEEAFEEKLRLCLAHIDHIALASANVGQIAVAIGTLFDKRQVLRGEPTQIMSMQDRRTMSELAKALQEEMERRQIDVTPERVDG